MEIPPRSESRNRRGAVGRLHLNGDRGQFAAADFLAEITEHQTSREAPLSLDKNGFLARLGQDSDPVLI